MVRIWRIVVCVLLACAIPAPTSAQATPPPQNQNQRPVQQIRGDFRDIDELDLDDLLNTTVSIASGRVERPEEAPSTVSVITDEEIRRMGVRTLAELLQTVPGFEVLTDNLGRNEIVVRGVVSQVPSTLNAVTQSASENVLVLFNGHRMNELFTGGSTIVNLDIPLYNIKQVEIIRGPGSALFGANAFLAVINLVSYTASNLEGFDVSAAGGSFGTQQYHVLAGHSEGALGISGSFQFADTAGPQLLVPKDGQTLLNELRLRTNLPPLQLSLAPRTTSSDRRGIDATVNATYKGLTLNGRVRDESSGAFVGYKGIFGPETDRLDTRQILFDADETISFARRSTLSAKFSFTQNEVRNFLSIAPAPPGNFFTAFDFSTNSRRYGADLVLKTRLSSTHELTVGTGFENESTFSPTYAYQTHFVGQPTTVFPFADPMIPVTGRTISSVFAQDVWSPIAALGVTAGARYDHYSDFGDTVNPRLGAVWRLPKRVHVKTLYGRAFRAPTLTELYANLQPFSLIVGNRNLTPSTINTFELALGYKDRHTQVDGTYFTNVVRDYIVGPVPNVIPATFYNSPGFTVRGVELEAKRTFGFDHAIFANYTYQHATDRLPNSSLVNFLAAFGATTGMGLPSQLATAGFTAGIGRHVSVTPTAILRGERPRCPAFRLMVCSINDPYKQPIAAYGVVNLNVRLKELFDRLEVAGTVNNLFDKRYTDPSGFRGVPGDYPKPGRNGLVTVTYKF
jgi:outer membrane receptor protein involved in Fe transport